MQAMQKQVEKNMNNDMDTRVRQWFLGLKICKVWFYGFGFIRVLRNIGEVHIFGWTIH